MIRISSIMYFQSWHAVFVKETLIVLPGIWCYGQMGTEETLLSLP